MPRTESNLFADNSQNRKFYYRNGLPGRISFPDRHSARRSPPAGVRSGPQGRHATALKGGSSREPTCLEQIGSAMSKGNLAHHHTCPAFCPRYKRYPIVSIGSFQNEGMLEKDPLIYYFDML